MKQHTIVLLVGPSCCGKTTFAKKIQAAIVEENLKCVIISSDDIRRDLLCDNEIHKLDASMSSVSAEAHHILKTKVDFHSKFPINTDVIIVDTTGLSAHFREEMIEIAKKNHYNIDMFVFDYPRSDLEGFVALNHGDMYVTGHQMKRLREEVMPNLNRKAYGMVQIFKKPEDAVAWIPTIENRDVVIQANEDDKIVVIGDVHECVDELVALFDKIPTNVNHIALLGDIVDKAEDTERLINLIFDMTKSQKNYDFFLIRGNHERYVYKRLKGILAPNEKLDNEFFQSFKVLSVDENLREKFFFLYENVMVDHLKFIRGREKAIILTHAPCSNVHLGKHDSKSSGKQINFYFTSRDQEKMLDELKFIEDEADSNHPWHLFGHVAHDGRQPKMIKNKIFMDTGCVHGGKLSAAVFNGRHVDFITVDSKREVHGLISLEKKETKLEKIVRSDINLSEEDQRSVDKIAKSGAKFISGTMAPAPSKDMDIESLEAAVSYFKERVTDVVIQPKYMGSRCQFYLYKDRAKNFATSRNGFKIKIDKLQEYMDVYQTWIEKSIKFEDELILDGELLPWSALGKGLIDGAFGQYQSAISWTLDNLSLDETFAGFDICKKLNITEQQNNLVQFQEQLALYGQDRHLEYKAFDILSIDGKIVAGKQNDTSFFVLNSDKTLKINLNEPDALFRIQNFFDVLVFDKGFEGIVIKPVSYDSSKNCVPYMKVRNKEYLRLVYGFNYASRLSELCKQKNTRGKMNLSIDEFELGQAILAEKDDVKRKHLISAMFGKIAKERTLDPRL